MKEGKDYILLPDGRLVFTATYLSERGYCCGNGCMNCPYDYVNVPDNQRSKLSIKETTYESSKEG